MKSSKIAKKTKTKKNKNKVVKLVIIFILVLIIFVSIFMIYKNLFQDSSSTRFKDIENYKLTNEEINSVKDVINELENIKNVDVYVNSKIIRIFITLTDDLDFDKVKSVSNRTIEKFSEENLSFYDLEIFVESENEESKVYPKIGYKFKANKEFVW